MKRKKFNNALTEHGFQRTSVRDEYGDYIYHYTHPSIEGEKFIVTKHEIQREGSSWSHTNLGAVATILVGAVTIGYDTETFRSVWSDVMERY